MENKYQSGMDFNPSDSEDNDGNLIPENTIAQVSITIQPGGEGADGILTRAKNSDVIMLSCLATVLSGVYAEQTFWVNVMLDGGKRDKDGRSKCGMIGRNTIRAILESARNIRPDDTSEAALAGRRINSWLDLDGLDFWAVIGIQKDKNGNYPDKNYIKQVLTPGMNGYGGVGASVEGDTPICS